MDDRLRASDADRDRVADALREHYAAGRLSADELDERLTTALSARTLGELNQVLTDLPGPARVLQPGGWRPPQSAPPVWVTVRRRPRVAPLVLLALLVVLVLPGAGWVLFSCAPGVSAGHAGGHAREHVRRGPVLAARPAGVDPNE